MRLKDRIRRQAIQLKKQILTLYFACRDPNLGRLPAFFAFLTLAYALSPIDLIPDFIPVLGLLDDMVILPMLVAITVRLIPEQIMRDAREKAEKETEAPRKRWLFVPVFISIWILIAILVIRLFLSAAE